MSLWRVHEDIKRLCYGYFFPVENIKLKLKCFLFAIIRNKTDYGFKLYYKAFNKEVTHGKLCLRVNLDLSGPFWIKSIEKTE